MDFLRQDMLKLFIGNLAHLLTLQTALEGAHLALVGYVREQAILYPGPQCGHFSDFLV